MSAGGVRFLTLCGRGRVPGWGLSAVCVGVCEEIHRGRREPARVLPSSHKKVNAEERGGRKGGRGSRPLPCLLPPQAGAACPGHAGTLVRAFFRPLSPERARVRARASSPPFFSGRPSLHGHGRTASRPRHSRARSQPAPAAPLLHAQRPGPGLPGPNPVQGRGQWGGALYWRLPGSPPRPWPARPWPPRRRGRR